MKKIKNLLKIEIEKSKKEMENILVDGNIQKIIVSIKTIFLKLDSLEERILKLEKLKAK